MEREKEVEGKKGKKLKGKRTKGNEKGDKEVGKREGIPIKEDVIEKCGKFISSLDQVPFRCLCTCVTYNR